jgi:hypothetical protein
VTNSRTPEITDATAFAITSVTAASTLPCRLYGSMFLQLKIKKLDTMDEGRIDFVTLKFQKIKTALLFLLNDIFTTTFFLMLDCIV